MRIFATLRNLCISLLCLTPLLSLADEVTVGDLIYELNAEAKEATIIGRAATFKTNVAWVIPSSITTGGVNYAVVGVQFYIAGVRDYRFGGNTQIPSVTIPNTIRTIGDYTFSNCVLLKEINLPNSVEVVGIRAFNNCQKVTSLTFPASVTSIGNYACLNMTSLKEVNFNTSCALPSTLFHNNGNEKASALETVRFTGTTSEVPKDLFKGITSLKNVLLNENVKIIKNSAFESCTGLTSFVFPENLETIDLYAFYQCENLAGKLTFPASCTDIGEAAFKGCFALEELEFNGGKKISQNAFEGDHSLKKVVFHDGVEQINVSAFAGCSGITDLTLPSTLKVLQSNAFQYCTNITTNHLILPESLTVLGSGCFQGCDKIEKVTIPAACTTMGGTAFKDCKGLKSAEILAAKGKLGAGTFQNCTALEYVHIGGGVTGILNNPFQGCTTLKTVDITAPLTTIGINCFSGCSSIENVTFPETLQSLNTSAFQGTSVKEYNLPGAVTSVARMSMDSNPSVIRVYSYGVPAAPSDIVQNYEDCWLYVVSGYEADYAAHPIWSKFAKVGRLPEPTSVIADDIDLKVDETYQIECELVPINTYARLFYTVEDESIATVDANGLVTAVHFGQTSIKITNVDGVVLGTVAVTVSCKYEAPTFKLLTWSAANYKAKNGRESNNNNISSTDADAAYDLAISNWQEMTADEIEAFHKAFQAFKNDKSDQYYNVPDGKFVYSYTITGLAKGTYITIDGKANDGKHWGVPNTIKNTQLASDGSRYFELWDGESGYPIIYNYKDGKDVTVEFYTLTFPQEKAGQYVTGPNQPHDVTLHVLGIVPGEQYTVPTYKLLVWDADTYKRVNGTTNSNSGTHEDAISSHDFETSEWQPMTAEEIQQFKSDYYDFKGTTNANKWYNEPDGKFVHTVTYQNAESGTHFTIDGRGNDKKHYGVSENDQDNKSFTTESKTFHELWDDTSGHPVIYNGENGNDVTVQFSTLTFPSNNAGGFTGEPTQPRYVSFVAQDPTISGLNEVAVSDGDEGDFEGAAIFTVAGRMVGTNVAQLPAGVYIQVGNGATRKLIIR